MRKGEGEVFGLRELLIAILAIVILLVIAVVLIRLVNPSATAAQGFGEQAAGVFDK